MRDYPTAFHHQPLPLPDQHPCQLAGTATLGTVIARTTLGGQVVSVDVRDAGGCVHRNVWPCRVYLFKAKSSRPNLVLVPTDRGQADA